MLNHKLTTYLILLLYGVPIALGPFWHRHSPEHAECCHETREASSPPLDCLSRDVHSNHCLKCDCKHSLKTVVDRRIETVQWSLANSQQIRLSLPSQLDCEGCAICRFYACPPLLILHGLRLEAEGWSQQMTCEADVWVPSQLSLPQARGPPRVGC